MRARTIKIIPRLFILLLFFSTMHGYAVNCRSGDAALRGSQVGYDRDKQAAEQTAKNDRSLSDTLGKCIGGITGVVTVPQFPSLSDIYDQVKKKICKLASDQAHNSVSGANSQINDAINGINGQINNAGIGQISENVPVAGAEIHQTGSATTPSSAFWSNIWK
jgi:TraL protein